MDLNKGVHIHETHGRKDLFTEECFLFFFFTFFLRNSFKLRVNISTRVQVYSCQNKTFFLFYSVTSTFQNF